MLLLEGKKSLRVNSLTVLPLCNSWNSALVPASSSYLKIKGIFSYFALMFRLSVTFWLKCLILLILNNLRNLFIFCINIYIDEMLLLEKNNSLRGNSFTVISLCNSWNSIFGFCFFILLNNWRNRFIFCIKVDIHEMLLLWKNKVLRINSFRVIPLCNSWQSFSFLLLILLNNWRNLFIFWIGCECWWGVAVREK